MEYHWTDIRDQASIDFSEDPGPQLEQDIIDHFTADPERVIRTIAQIKSQHQRKPLNSPWAVLRSALNRTQQPDVTADASTSRQKTIDRAKAWIRNAGCYHETWEACAAELFGDPVQTAPLAYLEQLERDTRSNPGRNTYGPLLVAAINRTREHGQELTPPDTNARCHSLINDQNARDQLQAEWHRTRPAAIQADIEAAAYAEKIKPIWPTIVQHRRLTRQAAKAEAQHATEQETETKPGEEAPEGHATPDASYMSSHASIAAEPSPSPGSASVGNEDDIECVCAEINIRHCPIHGQTVDATEQETTCSPAPPSTSPSSPSASPSSASASEPSSEDSSLVDADDNIDFTPTPTGVSA